MTAGIGLLERVRSALGRNAGADLPAGEKFVEPLPANAASPDPQGGTPGNPGAEPQFDAGLVCVLAEKVLGAWLRNRYQLLFPLAFDLKHLEPGQAELLVGAMLAAAQADGSMDGKERQRIENVLQASGGAGADRASIERSFSHPKPLHEILSAAREVQTGALVYAASVMAVDERKPVNRLYLDYLAARLQLSQELVASIEQRFRSAS